MSILRWQKLRLEKGKAAHTSGLQRAKGERTRSSSKGQQRYTDRGKELGLFSECSGKAEGFLSRRVPLPNLQSKITLADIVTDYRDREQNK